MSFWYHFSLQQIPVAKEASSAPPMKVQTLLSEEPLSWQGVGKSWFQHLAKVRFNHRESSRYH